MNHDPQEHFSEAQIEVISSIFESKINNFLLKTIGTYVVTMLLCVLAVGGAWFRLENVEEGLAIVTTAVHDALPSKEYVDSGDSNLQTQIDGTSKRLDRIENKIDIILDRI